MPEDILRGIATKVPIRVIGHIDYSRFVGSGSVIDIESIVSCKAIYDLSLNSSGIAVVAVGIGHDRYIIISE